MSRGFTLVEILVVLVILGVVATATVPAITQYGRRAPGEATSQALIELLRAARREATQSGVPISAVVDSRSGRFWIVGPERARRTGVLDVEVDAVLRAPTRRVSFLFDPTGPAHGDSIVVEMDATRAVVGVDRWTGRPHVR